MTTRAVPEMRDWATRPFDGGYAGLHDLAGQEFTGGVEAGDAVLFMLRGRAVGVFRRDDEAEAGLRPTDIEAFEEAAGTAYEAPHPALPLLFAMQATGGEERGRYYSEDTPLEEVHERLSGGFTGYVELSENVLSGDYYLVYHGGRSKQVAFVGQSDRLLEDEEAFERACGEVGIYTVTAVDLDPVDIPGAPDRSTGAAAGAGLGASGATGDDAPTAGDAGTTTDVAGSAADPDTDADDGTGADLDTGTGTGLGPGAEDGGADTSGGTEATGTDLSADIPTVGDSAADGTDPDPPAPRDTASDGEVRAAVSETEEAPDETADGETAADGPADDETAAGAAATGSEAAALREELAAREAEVAELEEEAEALETETEELERQLQAVRDERDDLAARVEDLEGRLRELGSGGAAPEEALDRATALGETSLFVRYRSKGDPTLEELAGGASREQVVGNLRLERHTEFDADAVAVDGRAFGAFLEDTQEYHFARWLMTDLPLEIRETGSQAGLSGVYEALPEIDRISFAESVEVAGDERTFDLVARDRMGNPLIVATLDESRDPTDEGRLAELVQDATVLAEEYASLAGAFAVTAAYFEPGALSTAKDATGGSLLSRDKRESFVKLSRNQGYHLCLVEDREESFYLSVPEL